MGYGHEFRSEVHGTGAGDAILEWFLSFQRLIRSRIAVKRVRTMATTLRG